MKKRTYKYVIELRQPMWPRKLVESLSYSRDIFGALVSVTDMQNDTHIYGATYIVAKDDEITICTLCKKMRALVSGGNICRECVDSIPF
jgi:hypothetical protein